MLSSLSVPPFSNSPHIVTGFEGNLPVGWLTNWNICQNEENSSRKTKFSNVKEMHISKMTHFTWFTKMGMCDIFYYLPSLVES